MVQLNICSIENNLFCRNSAGQQSSLKLKPVQEQEEETSILADDKNSKEAPKNKTKGATVTSAKKSIEETSTAQCKF